VSIAGTTIDAQRDLQGNVDVVTHGVDNVAATQNFVPASEVRTDLVNRILGLGLVAAQLTERAIALGVAEAFLDGAGVAEGTDENWTSRRAAQAVDAISSLVRAAYARNERRPAFVWTPVTLLQPRPAPAVIHEWYEDFVVRQWYGGWSKSAEAAAAFDSDSGEFAFAKLVDTSDGVAWWLRLYQSDPAYITLPSIRRYYPDFVVIDTAGVHWLVEAKSDIAAANDTDVAAKKSAAEEWAAAVNDSKQFGMWRYLLVTESEIKKAANWEGLVSGR
jgi:type III restriction enzyme